MKYTRITAERGFALLFALTILVAGARSTLPIDDALAQTYRTVDDILKGTPFRIVDAGAYQKEIQYNQRAVAFFYSNNMVEGGSGSLAKVYQEIFREKPNSFSNLTFLALKSEPGKEGEYLSLGFEISPSTAYVLNGKKIASNKGGPTNDKEHAEAKRILLDNLTKLNALVLSPQK